MVEPELSEVVLQAQRGDRRAVEGLVRRFMRPAYLVALSIVRVPVEAEDLAQEAMAMSMQQLDTCREPARFAGWLLSNVRNRALNRLEALQVRQRYADGASPEEPQTSLDDVAARSELLAALSVLTEQQREVVLLHDLEGWTHPEIAQATGLSEVNSRQVLSVARRTVRARLEALQRGGDDA